MKPIEALQEFWGFNVFRPQQEEIINEVLTGSDVLALLPTGGGKSLCFQIPAMCQPGLTIVISPLIALMKDQVFHLKKRNIQAEAIYSGMSYFEKNRILDNCTFGSVKFLYVSPERFISNDFALRLQQMKVNLFAIDEAHCISQWGYDFRPTYLDIATVTDVYPKIPKIAVTASATKKVQDDIIEHLHLQKHKFFKTSFHRENLTYNLVQECENKLAKTIEILQYFKSSAIIYVRSRRKTEEIADMLQRRNISATSYHAGLSQELRTNRQDEWMQNKVQVMICTNAFGMGIDKPDVTTVIHLDVPYSIEEYFQEVGRAGRNGKSAYGIMITNAEDQQVVQQKLQDGFPSKKEVRLVYKALMSFFQLGVGRAPERSMTFYLHNFTKQFNLNFIRTKKCLQILERMNVLMLRDGQRHISTVIIDVQPGVLFQFQLANPKLTPLIKYLLRHCEGIYTKPSDIYETRICKDLSMIKKDLNIMFQRLEQSKIMTYTPKSEEPSINFTGSISPADALDFELANYNLLRKSEQYQLGVMLQYIENTSKCRNQFILQYFGEQSEPCGACDVCRTLEKESEADDVMDQLMNMKGTWSIKEIQQKFKHISKAKVLQHLRILQDEDIFEIVDDKVLFKDE